MGAEQGDAGIFDHRDSFITGWGGRRGDVTDVGYTMKETIESLLTVWPQVRQDFMLDVRFNYITFSLMSMIDAR
jgi:hypothetical protein